MYKFGEIIGNLKKEDKNYIFETGDLKIKLEEKDVKDIVKIRPNKKKIFKDALKENNLLKLEELALEALLEYPEYITYFNNRYKMGILKNIHKFNEIKKMLKTGKTKSPKKISQKILDKYLELTRNPNEVFLYLTEDYEVYNIDELAFYKPSLIAITGLNGHGKSFFSLYLLNNFKKLNPNLKIGYLINEDFTLPTKIKDELNFINFHIPQDYNSLLYLAEEYDILIVDAFSNIDLLQDVSLKSEFNNNSYFNNALIDLYTLTHSKKSIIFLIVHLTKQARLNNKNEDKVPSLYEAYTGRLSIYIDMGLVIHKTQNQLGVYIQKNRFGTRENVFYDFQDIINAVLKEVK